MVVSIAMLTRVRVCVKGVCLAVIVFMFLLTEDMEKLKNPAFRARKKGRDSLRISSFIQTVLSAPELQRVCQKARGLYRRWGISPRPEDI